MSRMSKKGQMVIPKAVRDKAGIAVEEELIVEARGNEIVVRRPVDLLNYKPRASRRDLGMTDREITDRAWEDRVAEKYGPEGQSVDR